MPVIYLAPNTKTGMYSTASTRTLPLVTYSMSTIYVNSGDVVTGYENGSTFIMGTGKENITAWLTNTTIYGGSGNDTVKQTAPMGGLTFIGGSGTNYVDGGSNSTLYGGSGHSTLIGGDYSHLESQSTYSSTASVLFEMSKLTDHIQIGSFVHGKDKLALHITAAQERDLLSKQQYLGPTTGVTFHGSVVPNLSFISAVSSITAADIKLI